MRGIIGSIEHEYRRYKRYAEGTFDQLSGDQQPDENRASTRAVDHPGAAIMRPGAADNEMKRTGSAIGTVAGPRASSRC